jgi:hypothetical protein
MSGFKLELTCDNAAFEGDPSVEIARIIRDLADSLDQGELDVVLRDINGNRVGKSMYFE